jgi:hypothetical protein
MPEWSSNGNPARFSSMKIKDPPEIKEKTGVTKEVMR